MITKVYNFFIQKKEEKNNLRYLSDDPYFIFDIKNPSEKLKLFAIKKMVRHMRSKSGFSLQSFLESGYYSDQSDQVLIELVKKDGELLKFIPPHRQSEKLCLLSIDDYAKSLMYVANKTDKLIKLAIKKNPFCIEFVEFPTKDQWLLALESNSLSLSCIKNQTEEMCLFAINKDSNYCFSHVKTQTPAICLAYLTQDPMGFQNIKICPNPNYPETLSNLVEMNQECLRIENNKRNLLKKMNRL